MVGPLNEAEQRIVNRYREKPVENDSAGAATDMWLAQAMQFVDRFSARFRPRIQVRPETLERCEAQARFVRDRHYISKFTN